MKLKNNRGVTGVDVAIAVTILTIFASLVATLFANTAITSKKIERKALATNIAIEVIEGLKVAGFENVKTTLKTVDELNGYIANDIDVPNGYSVAISVEDYLDENLVKIISVDVEYKDGKNTEKVDIATLVKKEANISVPGGSGGDESTTSAPVIESVLVDSKTTNSITIASIATDADEDDLTYMLYTGESSDSLELAETSAVTSQGTEIILTKSSLKEYTDYYYRIDVTDGKATTEGEVKSVRTYCPGGTINTTSCENCEGDGNVDTKVKCTCSGILSETKTETCPSDQCGKGTVTNTIYLCENSSEVIVKEQRTKCPLCTVSISSSTSYHYYTKSEKCENCEGTGNSTVTTYCDHDRTEQHDD